MSDFSERIQQMSPKRLTLLALELQEKLEAVEAGRREPIAIVGMACRFPGGADTPKAFWELLRGGVDAIRETPADRWDTAALFDPDPDAPGRLASRYGGFLSEIDRFDANVFGISPREAQSMDPQQRLLLEVAWEALEDSGQAPDSLGGSPTGVFVGACNADYYQHLGRLGTYAIDAYRASGNASSVISGRVSYVLGLHGPAITVDTACSSSLVAVHLACQSLWSGECRMALAGGVNVLCSPETTIALSRARMMAPDGRCKAFDSRADGFVRGEGCGIVVLKRLSLAQAAGDRILAVIRSSAANQDGRSSGITAPNGPSQEAVMRAALSRGGVEPADVDYVEAHGTGTSLGDPIEARALGAVFRVGRPLGRPLRIGSVKTNIGHLESAAGVAGLMKVVLSLQHEEIPPHLHVRERNPHVDWSTLPLDIPTELTPWPRAERPRLAGLSSFGFSGTNAHLILEEAPAAPPRPSSVPERPRHALTVSGKTELALLENAERLGHYLSAHPEASLADVAHTTNVGRARLPERAVVLAANVDEARARLQALADGGEAPGLVRGRASTESPRVAFLFTGQGAQYVGMGRGLYDTQPTFKKAIDQCADILKGRLDKPLLDVLFGAPGSEGLIDRTDYTQPCLFALEWALFELWRSFGVEPSAVLGHSAGEIVAACAAGVFSVEEALPLIVERGRLMEALPPAGGMAAVFADEARVTEVMARLGGRLWIAAVNAADNVVVSGDEAALAALLAHFAALGVNGKRLAVSNAFHSPLVEPMLDDLEKAAARVEHRSPRIDLVSNLTGAAVRPGELKAPYWRRHVREAVRFADSVRSLFDQGYRIFVEAGPHPTLLNMVQGGLGAEAACLPSLRRGGDDWTVVLESLAALHVKGVPVDWSGYDRDYSRTTLALPTYAFQRERFWIDAPPPASSPGLEATPATSASSHPLLGPRSASALPTFEKRLGPGPLPWLAEHRVFGVALAAAPVLLEMLQAAAAAAGSEGASVEGLVLREPLVFPEDGERVVQVVLVPSESDDVWQGRVFSRSPRAGETDAWVLHASAQVRPALPLAESRVALDEVRARTEETSPAAFYEALKHRGIELGDAFRGIGELRRGPGEALGLVSREDAASDVDATSLRCATLDACLQVIGAAAPGDWSEARQESTYLLSSVESARLPAVLPKRLFSHARLSADAADGSLRGDVVLCDAFGQRIGELGGVLLRRASREALRAAVQGGHDWLYEMSWPQKPLSGQRIAGPTAEALPEPSDIVEQVRPRLRELAREHGLSAYDESIPRVDALARAYARLALATLGYDPGRDGHAPADEVAARLGVKPIHRRLFARCLEAAAGEGAPDLGEVEALREDLLARHPHCAPEVGLVARCGRGLADVWRGAADPLQLLFPDGSFAAVESLYRDSPVAQAYNQALAAAVSAAVAALPVDRPVRVLEVGAGTGGSTSFILPALPRERTRYVFTDLSRLFMARAAETFRDYPFVEYTLLDAEKPFPPQGLPAASFDIVVASNALHATQDLAATLRNVREALAPGGLLLLLEGTRPHLWVDVTFGLTEGWWRFSDTGLRPSYALLDVARWKGVLQEVGFSSSASLFGEGDGEGLGRQSILVAREPRRSSARAPAPSRKDETGSWLVVGDGGGLAQELVTVLRAEGGRVVHAPARKDRKGEPGAADFREEVAAARREAGSGELRVVHLAALDRPRFLDDAGKEALSVEVEAAVAFTRLLRALADDGGTARLNVVTRGAQSVARGSGVLAPEQASVWGLGRVASLEHPRLFGALVDLDPAGASDAETLKDELVTAQVEDQVAFRAGARHAARLVRQPAPRTTTAFSGNPLGWHLVTGGLGGLGLSLARWLVDRGARHLVLTSRRGLPPPAEWPALKEGSEAAGQAAAITELRARGARVDVVRVDVSDEDAMRALIDAIDGHGPLRSVFHLAVDMSSVPLVEADSATIESMFRAKVEGACVLHRLMGDRDLDAFVLFSSTTALLGVAGLGHYAAANLFLDALAHHRRARGLPALSVNWGTWETMRAASDEQQREFRQSGLLPMDTGVALDVMARLLVAGAAQATVAHVDWTALASVYESRRRRPLFSDLATEPLAGRRPAAKASKPSSDLALRFAQAPASRRRDLVLAHVKVEVARILGLDGAQPIDLQQGLFEMGMDSLMSVELKSRLEGAVGRSLPSTLTFNYPSVGALTDYLTREVLGAAAAPPVAPPTSAVPAATATAAAAPTDTDDMSEAELLALLAGKLEGMDAKR